MPRKDFTEIICIIDRSGSMDRIKEDAIGGFNTFLEGQKGLPGTAGMTLCLFNDGYSIIHNGVNIQEVPKLDEYSYIPGGTTALLDAVGRTIDAVGERLANTPEEERPDKVLVCIITDGLENASREYKKDQIKERIKHQSEKYNWEFIYLGANQDAFAEAGDIGISRGSTMAFCSTKMGVTKVYDDLHQRTTDYRKTGKI